MQTCLLINFEVLEVWKFISLDVSFEPSGYEKIPKLIKVF